MESNLILWLVVGTISVTNYSGNVVSGTFVRANRSHVFIRNADGVVRAMPYSALPPQERARVREMAEPSVAPVPATASKGEKR